MKNSKKQIIVERCEDGMIAVHTNFDCEVMFLDSSADKYNCEESVLEEYQEISKLKSSEGFIQKSRLYL